MASMEDREVADGSIREEALPAYRQIVVAQFLSLSLPLNFLARVVRNSEIGAVCRHIEQHRVALARAPVGAQVHIDRAASIIEIAWVNGVQKTIRAIRRGVGEKTELLSDAAPEGRGDVSRAEISRAGAQAAGDAMIDPGLRLHDDDGGVASAELGWYAAGDHLQ